MMNFLKNVMIFIKYIITQPFKEIMKMTQVGTEKIQTIANLASWRIPLTALLTVFIIFKQYTLTQFALYLLVVAIIKTEWDEKKWLVEYRKKRDKELEKELEAMK